MRLLRRESYVGVEADVDKLLAEDFIVQVTKEVRLLRYFHLTLSNFCFTLRYITHESVDGGSGTLVT